MVEIQDWNHVALVLVSLSNIDSQKSLGNMNILGIRTLVNLQPLLITMMAMQVKTQMEMEVQMREMQRMHLQMRKTKMIWVIWARRMATRVIRARRMQQTDGTFSGTNDITNRP